MSGRTFMIGTETIPRRSRFQVMADYGAVPIWEIWITWRMLARMACVENR